MIACFRVDGPPVGAVRTTQKSKWRDPAAQRYFDYTKHVRASFLEQLGHRNREPDFQLPMFELKADQAALVEYFCSFTSEVHPDPENVGKSLCDALFSVDKHVLPRCVGFVCKAEAPFVEVRIRFGPLAQLARPAAFTIPLEEACQNNPEAKTR